MIKRSHKCAPKKLLQHVTNDVRSGSNIWQLLVAWEQQDAFVWYNFHQRSSHPSYRRQKIEDWFCSWWLMKRWFFSVSYWNNHKYRFRNSQVIYLISLKYFTLEPIHIVRLLNPILNNQHLSKTTDLIKIDSLLLEVCNNLSRQVAHLWVRSGWVFVEHSL